MFSFAEFIIIKFITEAYSAFVLLIALIALARAPGSRISRFYLYTVAALLLFGLAGRSMPAGEPHGVLLILHVLLQLLFALLPFMFVHFLLVFVGLKTLEQNRLLLGVVYFAALFSFSMILCGYLPSPISGDGGLTTAGNFFYFAWLSIYFCMGLTQLYSLYGGFTVRDGKSRLLVSILSVLLLILPGPFSESITKLLFRENPDVYIIVCSAGLILSIYFVIRYKSLQTINDSLRSILTVMNDVIFKTDEDMNIELVKGGLTYWIGLQEKALVGKNLAELLIPDDYLKGYLSYVKSGKMREGYFDAEMTDSRGFRLTFNFSFSPIMPDNTLTGFIAIAREITERKRSEEHLSLTNEELEHKVLERTEELRKVNEELRAEIAGRKRVETALRRNREMFQMLVDNSNDLIIMLDATMTVLHTSPSVTSQLGWKNNDVTGKKIIQFVDPSEAEEIKNKFTTLIASPGSVLELEHSCRHHNGSYSRFHSVGKSFTGEAGQLLVVLNSRDISARDAHERELRYEKALLQNLMDRIPDPIYFMDAAARYTRINRAHAYVLHVTAPEFATGKTDFEFLPNSSATEEYEENVQLLRTGKPVIEKIKSIRLHNGSTQWFSQTKVPITDERGNITGLVGISRNISEIKEAKETSDNYSTRLEKVIADKDRFFSILSHDLMNPFHGLLGFSNLLYDDYDELNDGERKKYTAYIHHSVTGLFRLVENLLAWSRLQTGRYQFELSDIDVQALFAEVIDTLRQTAELKGVEMTNLLPGGLRVKGDEMMLTSIFENLAINAIKFSEEGTTITLDATAQADSIELRVHDQGVGMAPETLDKLFKLDTIVSTPGTRGEKGNGLGLLLVREMVEIHKGTITVVSLPGSGTTFTVKLPRA